MTYLLGHMLQHLYNFREIRSQSGVLLPAPLKQFDKLWIGVFWNCWPETLVSISTIEESLLNITVPFV